jgi:Ca2+/H+ antiporter
MILEKIIRRQKCPELLRNMLCFILAFFLFWFKAFWGYFIILSICLLPVTILFNSYFDHIRFLSGSYGDPCGSFLSGGDHTSGRNDCHVFV